MILDIGRDAAEGDSPPGPRRVQTFDEFYAAHFPAIALQIYVSFGDRAEAQYIAQEAFLRGLSRWDRLVSADDPVAWVRRVAWRLAVSRWRRVRAAFHRRDREEAVGEPRPDHVALAAALGTLPARYRRAVVLHYLADLSVAEVAAEEGVAVGVVTAWLSRGRDALTRALGETNDEEVA